MGRDIHASLIAALSSGGYSPFYAIDLMFHNPAGNGGSGADTPLYLWTGSGDLSANGNTYLGAGSFLSIGNLEEAAELKATGCTISFSGADATLINAALNHEYSGRKAKIYFGVVGNTNLVEVFTGFMDTLSIGDSADNSSIRLNIENRLIDLQRTNAFRYTQESHANLYSGDSFFSYVQDLQDKEVEWGPN